MPSCQLSPQSYHYAQGVCQHQCCHTTVPFYRPTKSTLGGCNLVMSSCMTLFYLGHCISPYGIGGTRDSSFHRSGQVAILSEC